MLNIKALEYYMASLYFVQNDTMPQIKLEITDNTTNTAVNLTNCIVTLHCKPSTGVGVKFSREATFPNAGDRAAGIAYIQWLDGDLNRAPGDYTGEIEIYNSSTLARETIYETISFTIREDIGDISPVSTEPTAPY